MYIFDGYLTLIWRESKTVKCKTPSSQATFLTDLTDLTLFSPIRIEKNGNSWDKRDFFEKRQIRQKASSVGGGA